MTPKDAEIERTDWYVFAMGACAAGSVMLVAYSTYHWLRFGNWAPITMADVVTAPHVDWVGADRTIEWLWGVRLWAYSMLAALGLVFVMDRPGR